MCSEVAFNLLLEPGHGLDHALIDRDEYFLCRPAIDLKDVGKRGIVGVKRVTREADAVGQG